MHTVAGALNNPQYVRRCVEAAAAAEARADAAHPDKAAAREARQWPPSTYRLSRGEARAEVSWHTVVCDCRVNAGAAGRTRLGLGWAWGGWGGVGDVSSNAM